MVVDNSSSFLNLPLRDGVPEASRPVIVEVLCRVQHPPLGLYNLSSGSTSHLESHCALFFANGGYYPRQCDIIGGLINDDNLRASVRTHGDIVRIAQLLQQPLSRDQVREAMANFLATPYSSESDSESITPEKGHDMAINLVARLMLMMRIGNVEHECIGGRQLLEWEGGGSLQKFVHQHFSKPARRSHERIRLEKQFNALNLHRIAGIEIRWTDNLADHLLMMNDDKTVAIFRHASFLELQRHNDMYPAGLIDETIRTLSLLFPRDDGPTRRWYRNVCTEHKGRHDPHLATTGILDAESRDFDNFPYWHDRLVVLKSVYDEARPANLRQWWYDDRNPVEWYTFWTAVMVLILTMLFGLIQCVEGGLQVWKAWNP
ncbi:hypothetical protein QBC46DRAFT_427126 [Diplogelasinospora grovesii]|uniref:Uncharacterized protein n=1 Tax=Diplogelasinospora grovesii TaxID=303347 RepID=A0AAN6MW04_9PEZI|nr:hypothetical protein QBC46DRAFT_427126 [Diplogelasinospora grovesii]